MSRQLCSGYDALRGIGAWTAAEVVQRSHGAPDVVSVGDYHLPNAVGFVLTGRPRTDDAGMLALLEPYRPHRQRVVRLVEASGIAAPRYGPRMALRDNRSHLMALDDIDQQILAALRDDARASFAEVGARSGSARQR